MGRKAKGMTPNISEWEDFSKDLGLIEPADLIEAVKDAGVFVYDLETTGLNPRRDRIEGIAFYVPASRKRPRIRAWFPFVEHTFMCTAKDSAAVQDLRPAMDQESTMNALRPIWEELTDVVCIAHHSKFDAAFLYYASGTDRPIEVNAITADSMLADFCSDERQRRYGLKYRVKLCFGHQMTTYNDAVRGHTLLAFCNAKPLGVYAMDDCYWTYRLHERGLASLRSQTPAPKKRTELRWTVEKQLGRVMGKLERIYWGIDTQISKIIMEMENSGVLIDWRWLRKVEEKIVEEKLEIATRIEKFLLWPLNPNSGKQVADALFAPAPDGLGLPMTGIPIGKNGEPSTADKVIKHFARFHPLVADILKWRSLDTVLTGFVTKLIKLATESPDGRVYAHFNQTRTVIARLSSSDPINFQNQPRDKNLVRRGYVSYREGIDKDDMRLYGADYGQIELRVAAHLSLETNMIEVYQMGGICTAEDGGPCDRYQWFECHDCDHTAKPEEKTPGVKTCEKCGSLKIEHQARCRHVDLHQRTAEDAQVKRNPLAKNCNFGLLYRMGAPKFCVYADLFDADGMPMVQVARDIILRWHSAYPAIAPFHDKTEAMLEQNGWIAQTIFGRRRRLDEEARHNHYRAVTQGIQFQVSGCVVPETLVLTENGYTPINCLEPSHPSIFNGAQFTRNYSVHETGEKEVFEVKLSDGRTLVCSGEHRLATMDGLELGWPKVADLSEGDLVATHDVLAPGDEADHGATPDDAYLVGALIGDGYYGDSRGFTIAASAKEPGWPESLEASITAACGPWIQDRIRWGLRKTSRGGRVKDLVVHSSRARSSLMVLGLDCVSKLEKRIPDWIYTASPFIRGACLAGLVDTDGSVLSYKQCRYTSLIINYTSRVRELVEGAFRLASSLGIDAAIRELDVASTSKKGGRTKQYRLDITYRGFAAFNRWVTLRHPRKAATLEGALAIIGKRAPRRELPKSFVKAVAALAERAPILASRHGSHTAFDDRHQRRKVQGYIGHARSGKAGENMIEAILNYIEEPGPKEALQLGWSKIISITSIGVRPTFDIELHSENHAYIANGLLTHNSAQDIMKTSMIKIVEDRNRRRDNARPAERKLWEKTRLLLQIHDEVVLEGPKELKPEITEMIKTNMESVGKGYLRVPLAVDVKSGTSWDDIH